MELIQQKIDTVADNVKLAWTKRYLLSQTAMEVFLVHLEKRTSGLKITVMSVEVKDKVIKNSICFSRKCH